MKKVKFLKEKVIYTIVTVLLFSISFISISYAFTGKTLLTGANVVKDVPVINFSNTDNFKISNDGVNPQTIEVLLTGRKNHDTMCIFDVYFVWNKVASNYVFTEENKIVITGKDNDYAFLNYTLKSSDAGEEFIGAYQIETPKGGTSEKNLMFDISYNNPNNLDKVYEGHIELRNVLCIKK